MPEIDFSTVARRVFPANDEHGRILCRVIKLSEILQVLGMPPPATDLIFEVVGIPSKEEEDHIFVSTLT